MRRLGFIFPLWMAGLIFPTVVSLMPSMPLMTLQANFSLGSSGTQLGLEVVYFCSIFVSSCLSKQAFPQEEARGKACRILLFFHLFLGTIHEQGQ